MSETDAVALAQSLFANAQTGYAIFLSLISGYLVVAHFMGPTLSKGQVVIVNFLFSSTSVYTMYIWHSFSSTGMYYSHIAAELRGDHHYGDQYTLFLGLGFNASLVIAALVFMWIVRHPKKE